MKKILFLTAVTVIFSFCKGSHSGPLVRESFDRNEQSKAMGTEKHQGRVVTSKADVKVEPCADCITISRILSDKNAYAGKVIKVRGQVTKYNAGIMGKNWVHIQDGTEYQDGFDLTVTTDIQTTPGQVITFEGKIALDKDFGYGYVYQVMMEDAKSIQ